MQVVKVRFYLMNGKGALLRHFPTKKARGLG